MRALVAVSALLFMSSVSRSLRSSSEPARSACLRRSTTLRDSSSITANPLVKALAGSRFASTGQTCAASRRSPVAPWTMRPPKLGFAG